MITQPELFLPSQLGPAQSCRCERERQLWACVLADALHLAKKPYRQVVVQEAREWIARNDGRVGGFNWICHTLGLEPDVVREAASTRETGWLRRHSSKMGQSRKVDGKLNPRTRKGVVWAAAS